MDEDRPLDVTQRAGPPRQGEQDEEPGEDSRARRPVGVGVGGDAVVQDGQRVAPGESGQEPEQEVGPETVDQVESDAGDEESGVLAQEHFVQSGRMEIPPDGRQDQPQEAEGHDAPVGQAEQEQGAHEQVEAGFDHSVQATRR